jgi:hypothetical protein
LGSLAVELKCPTESADVALTTVRSIPVRMRNQERPAWLTKRIDRAGRLDWLFRNSFFLYGAVAGVLLAAGTEQPLFTALWTVAQWSLLSGLTARSFHSWLKVVFGTGETETQESYDLVPLSHFDLGTDGTGSFGLRRQVLTLWPAFLGLSAGLLAAVNALKTPMGFFLLAFVGVQAALAVRYRVQVSDEGINMRSGIREEQLLPWDDLLVVEEHCPWEMAWDRSRPIVQLSLISLSRNTQCRIDQCTENFEAIRAQIRARVPAGHYLQPVPDRTMVVELPRATAVEPADGIGA